MKIRINEVKLEIHGEYIKDVMHTQVVHCHQINCMSTNGLLCKECVLRTKMSVNLNEVQ